jgi:L-lactate dehydrogenase complex protein LldG
MSGRATVMGKIGAGLRRGGVAARHSAPGAPNHPEISETTWPQDLLVERFDAELTAIAGRVHRAATVGDATDAIVAVCREHGVSRVLGWAPQWIGVPGLHDALAAAGIDVDEGWLPDGGERTGRLAELDPVRVGITGAFAGIAGSGTIAVVSGPGRPRLASLLVPVHLAVLRADCLYPSLAALLAAHANVVEEGSNLVLITGPSRTADIEMTLTRGVHGPGEIHVILLGAAARQVSLG